MESPDVCYVLCCLWIMNWQILFQCFSCCCCILVRFGVGVVVVVTVACAWLAVDLDWVLLCRMYRRRLRSDRLTDIECDDDVLFFAIFSSLSQLLHVCTSIDDRLVGLSWTADLFIQQNAVYFVRHCLHCNNKQRNRTGGALYVSATTLKRQSDTHTHTMADCLQLSVRTEIVVYL